MPETVYHRPAPQAVDLKSKGAGLRAIAMFEGAKGALILLLGLGVLTLIHKDVGDEAERIVRALHMDPSKHMASAIIDAAYNTTDSKLWAIAAAGIIDAIVRFTVAYGLWNRRVWAEWFALLGGALYLPWEIYEILEKRTPLRVSLLVINLVIVLYMLSIRIRASRPVAE